MRRTQFVLWEKLPAEIRKRLADGIAGSSMAQPPTLLAREDDTPPPQAGIRWWTIFVSAFAFGLYAMALATNAGGPVNYGSYCSSGAPLVLLVILHACLVGSGAFTLLFVWRDGVTVDLPRGAFVFPTDLVEVLDHGIRVTPLVGVSVMPAIRTIRLKFPSGETQDFLADPHWDGQRSVPPTAVARAGEIAGHLAAAADAIVPDAALQHLAALDVFRGFRSLPDGALRSGSDAPADATRKARTARTRYMVLAVLATLAIVIPVDVLHDRSDDSRCAGHAAERGY